MPASHQKRLICFLPELQNNRAAHGAQLHQVLVLYRTSPLILRRVRIKSLMLLASIHAGWGPARAMCWAGMPSGGRSQVGGGFRVVCRYHGGLAWPELELCPPRPQTARKGGGIRFHIDSVPYQSDIVMGTEKENENNTIKNARGMFSQNKQL